MRVREKGGGEGVRGESGKGGEGMGSEDRSLKIRNKTLWIS